jgi:diguanylate cyclase (GGDEF)-like protein
MIRWLRERFDRTTLLHGRVYQSMWVEVVVAATAASALMAVVAGMVVFSQGVNRLEHETDELQRQLSTGLTSYEPLYNLQRRLQQATSSQQAAAAVVVDQRGVVLAASNNALVGLPMAEVLRLPAQHDLRPLFSECPSSSTLLSCLSRSSLVFTGPLPVIGGDMALAMRPYPLALEGYGRFGDRATLITVTDAREAARQAVFYTLIVFLAGLLPLTAGCVGLMLRLRQRLIPELLRLAQVDALSGVLNRRAFMETAADLLRRARQSELPMTLALIDVDHFKQINDTYGHDAGDQVIRQVSELLRRSVRSSDLVGRLGGDEFVLLVQLPGDAATQTLERTLQLVGSTDMGIGDDGPVTVTLSVGMASCSGHAGYVLSDLMTAADAALYVAKDRGRAQVVNLELEMERSRLGRRAVPRVGEWQIRGA